MVKQPEYKHKKLKISVIIPVYNVEPYLHQCVDSVLSQTYKNIEVILVDDGSPDNCPAICDQYAEADARVKVIHQKNGGLSAARNAGVQCASGDYITFLDSDDFWGNSEGLRKISLRLEKTNPDVLNFSYAKCTETGEVISHYLNCVDKLPLEITDTEAQLEFLTKHSLFIASAWNKILRRNIAKALPFEKEKTSEDIDWCARLMCLAQSFDFICVNLCYYRQRATSITHNITEKNCIDLKNNILRCVAIMNESQQNRRISLATYTAYQLATFFAIQALASNCPQECISELRTCKSLLHYHGGSKKVAYLDLGCRIIGFTNMCHLIRLTRRIWS